MTAEALDQEHKSGERKWRRRSLWSLVLLIPLALAVESYDSVRTLLRNARENRT